MLFDKVSNSVSYGVCALLLSSTFDLNAALSPLNNQFTAVFQGRGRIRPSHFRLTSFVERVFLRRLHRVETTRKTLTFLQITLTFLDAL